MNKKSWGSESYSKKKNNSEAVIPMSLAYKEGICSCGKFTFSFPTGLATNVEKATQRSFSVPVNLSCTMTLILIWRKENKPSITQIRDSTATWKTRLHTSPPCLPVFKWHRHFSLSFSDAIFSVMSSTLWQMKLFQMWEYTHLPWKIAVI